MKQTGNIPGLLCFFQASPQLGRKEGPAAPPGIQQKGGNSDRNNSAGGGGGGWTPSSLTAGGRQGANKDRTNRRTRHFEHEHEILSKTELLERGAERGSRS